MLVRFHFTPAGWFWYVAEEQVGLSQPTTRRLGTSADFIADSTLLSPSG
jgi:hypothetical protein